MPDNFTAVVGLLVGSFTLAGATMKLRAEIDARRDVALGIAKDSQAIPRELRLYILRKDVFERGVAIVLLLLSTGAIATVAAAYIRLRVAGIDAYLTALLALFGISCLVGGGCVMVLGRRDFREWEAFIRSDVWRGQRLDLNPLRTAGTPPPHDESD